MKMEHDSDFVKGNEDSYFLDHTGEQEYGWQTRPCEDGGRQKEKVTTCLSEF